MKYMLLIYSQETEDPLPADELEQLKVGHRSVMQDACRQGVLVGVERLKPTRSATTVRTKNGAPLILDGPFAETKEQLAGYYILECVDLDEAIEWGQRIPTACKGRDGCIEIRPVDDLPGSE